MYSKEAKKNTSLDGQLFNHQAYKVITNRRFAFIGGCLVLEAGQGMQPGVQLPGVLTHQLACFINAEYSEMLATLFCCSFNQT